jgi:putative FmdB family regulatory protein
MPRYEYSCKKCGTFEVNQRISDPALTHHTCGAPAERLISPSAFALKGGGWYADGYGVKKGSSSSESKASSAD